MPGRGKRANRTANASIYHVYKYFEKGSAKSKYRGPPKFTSKIAKATAKSQKVIISVSSCGALYYSLFTLRSDRKRNQICGSH